MSLAGIRSNRGDAYQTYIAVSWAITVLSDPDYVSIENDSMRFAVDDVVITKQDGTTICCQCKKNQQDFNAWTITDLADDLSKAIQVLSSNNQCLVKFYSRSNFGLLDKLKELSELYDNETLFLSELTKALKSTNDDLAAKINAENSNLSTFEFLRRTSFEVSPDFEQLKLLIRERLRQIVSNSSTAYDVLWRSIDELGGRVNDVNRVSFSQHRLTKDDLKVILMQSGAVLTPTMFTLDIQSSFTDISSIGRSWQRDIGGHQIKNRVVDKILAAIQSKNRSILLSGNPGSGKTCTMLTLQEELEKLAIKHSNISPLFIQTREYANLTSAVERQSLGLPDHWVEQAARLAESTNVVVIIDSLDVLSIARENTVLTYFLAKIDRLLLVPNIRVVTACREFDRKYDRRLSSRHWDYEVACDPLDFDTEVAPILESSGIDAKNIDEKTRDLISNPRELSLFVELAKREGAFNVVASQTLAQHYLETVVLSDPLLGDTAIDSIKDIAVKMLKARSLSIPAQQFSASQDILRRLKSLKILQYSHDGSLTFGHQTLLDAIVIYSAIQNGQTLNVFIQNLPQVPFVRPSIRMFVEQLAMGNRREFRKQLRTALLSNIPFHIRRLIAETFSKTAASDDDWPLILDLYKDHRETFQAIYNRASNIEWHYFWLKHFVPYLIDKQDAQGLSGHLYRVSQWKNEDPESVLQFWMSSFDLACLDSNTISIAIGQGLADLKIEALPIAVPLLEKLLDLPVPEYSSIGRAISRSVKHGAANDKFLWRYISREINDDTAKSYHIDSMLHCQPYELDDTDEHFLVDRIKKSTELLDFALNSIEHWSKIRASRYNEYTGIYSNEFLAETSYNNAHSLGEHHYGSERTLFDALEAAILHHSENNSLWWLENRKRIAFSFEDAIRYFSILALRNKPDSNTEIIGLLLCDVKILESSLSHEICELINRSFHFLTNDIQDDVMKSIYELWKGRSSDEKNRPWIQKRQAEYLSAIPCYLRPPEAQAIIAAHQNIYGALNREPSVHLRGGIIQSPFSFEIFLRISAAGITRLLDYFANYKTEFEDFLTGGKNEVAGELREASSRHPLRFLNLLESHFQMISPIFRDAILDGIASNLSYRFGDLRANTNWAQFEEVDTKALENKILAELEDHALYWNSNRSAARTLESLAFIIDDSDNANRLIELSSWHTGQINDPGIDRDSDDLIATGINSKLGNASESLIILANRFLEKKRNIPNALTSCLRSLAASDNSVIHALVLRRLPYLQYKDPALGWDLFDSILNNPRVWRYTEQCLFHAYHNNFDKISSTLNLLYDSGVDDDLETWGRISALSAFAGHFDLPELISKLLTRNATNAWVGAASVWAHIPNIRMHKNQCFLGLESGLNAGHKNSIGVAHQMANIFRDTEIPILVPANLVCSMFDSIEDDAETRRNGLYGFDKWLNSISYIDPMAALQLLERYALFIKSGKMYFYDHENRIVQLLTRLFAESEEREESDDGEMLMRVVALQDQFLSLGLNSINEWLKAAERQ